MKCAKCSAENPDGGKFCNGCGGTLDGSAAAATGGADFNKALQKLGTGGKIAGACFGVGFIASFLPWVSAFGFGISALSAGAFEGILFFLACIAGLVFAAMHGFGSNPQTATKVLWGMVGSSGLAILMVAIFFIRVMSSGPATSDESHMMAAMGVGIGFGAILSILAAAGMGIGSFMKAKESKLF